MRIILTFVAFFCLLGVAHAQSQQTSDAGQYSRAYQEGAADRGDWELWSNGLTGEFRAGAFYWAGQRSAPKPLSCPSQGSQHADEWMSGCVAAAERLSGSDVRRRREADYKQGWNSPTLAKEADTSTFLQPIDPQATTAPRTFVADPNGVAFLKALLADDIRTWSTGGNALFDYSSFGPVSLIVDAPILARDYSANEIAADNKYRDKAIAVRGVILSIGKNVFNGGYVELDAQAGPFTNIHANLASEAVLEAAGYQKGQQVQLMCRGAGMIVGSPVLSDCHSTGEEELKKTRSLSVQVERWIALGEMPAFAGIPNGVPILFAAYWFGTQIPPGASCPSKLDTCLPVFKQRVAAKGVFLEFKGSYIAATEKLKLPVIDWKSAEKAFKQGKIHDFFH